LRLQGETLRREGIHGPREGKGHRKALKGSVAFKREGNGRTFTLYEEGTSPSQKKSEGGEGAEILSGQELHDTQSVGRGCGPKTTQGGRAGKAKWYS